MMQINYAHNTGNWIKCEKRGGGGRRQRLCQINEGMCMKVWEKNALSA
jgi:hypothetical protein